MAINTNRGKERIIQNIKDVGQALIDDAENIVNSCNYIKNIQITCYVSDIGEPSYFNVDIDYYSKDTINRYTKK